MSPSRDPPIPSPRSCSWEGCKMRRTPGYTACGAETSSSICQGCKRTTLGSRSRVCQTIRNRGSGRSRMLFFLFFKKKNIACPLISHLGSWRGFWSVSQTKFGRVASLSQDPLRIGGSVPCSRVPQWSLKVHWHLTSTLSIYCPTRNPLLPSPIPSRLSYHHLFCPVFSIKGYYYFLERDWR